MSNLLLAIQEDPSSPQQYRYLWGLLCAFGRLEDARAVVAPLRAITPSVMRDPSQLRNPEHRELLLSGLRLAMGEAT